MRLPTFLLALLLAAVAMSAMMPAPACATAAPDTLFVEVQRGVSLEVLDWGGAGPDVVLLAGVGSTAHVFEDFAPLLVRYGHVRAITRRGFGASTRSINGYDPRNLARDVRVVCDSLSIARPVLVGHSLAGSEMAWFAYQWPGRARGFVFLDAAYDHDRIGELDDLAPRPASLAPPKSAYVSADAVRDWILETSGFMTPMGEIRALFSFGSDGRLIDATGSGAAPGHIRQALVTPPYDRIDAPTLAIFVKPTLASSYPARRLYGRDDLARVRARVALDREWMATQVASFQQRVPQATVVVRDGANHHIFLTETAGTAAAVGAFLGALDQ